MAPPSIKTIALFEQPQRVNKASIKEILEALALFACKTFFAAIRLGISQVVFGVSYIEVAAKHDRLAFLKLSAVGQKGWIPVLVPQAEPAQIVLGIWRVHSHHVEFVVLGGDDTAFACRITGCGVHEIIFFGERFREAIGDSNGLRFRKNRRAAVAFFFGGIPIF